MNNSDCHLPSTSSSEPQWPDGSFYREIANMTHERLWQIVHGGRMPSEKAGSHLFWRLKNEIKLVGNAIASNRKVFISKGMEKHISEFLHSITVGLCRFEDRFFPSDWVLSDECCKQSPYSREHPEGKHTMIVEIRLHQVKIVRRKTDESRIGSHLPEVLEEDSDSSPFHIASRFFRRFLESAVGILYGYSIQWVVIGGGSLKEERRLYKEEKARLRNEEHLSDIETEGTRTRKKRRKSDEEKLMSKEERRRLRRERRLSRQFEESVDEADVHNGSVQNSPQEIPSVTAPTESISAMDLLKSFGTSINFSHLKKAMATVHAGRKRISETVSPPVPPKKEKSNNSLPSSGDSSVCTTPRGVDENRMTRRSIEQTLLPPRLEDPRFSSESYQELLRKNGLMKSISTCTAVLEPPKPPVRVESLFVLPTSPPDSVTSMKPCLSSSSTFEREDSLEYVPIRSPTESVQSLDSVEHQDYQEDFKNPVNTESLTSSPSSSCRVLSPARWNLDEYDDDIVPSSTDSAVSAIDNEPRYGRENNAYQPEDLNRRSRTNSKESTSSMSVLSPSEAQQVVEGDEPMDLDAMQSWNSEQPEVKKEIAEPSVSSDLPSPCLSELSSLSSSSLKDETPALSTVQLDVNVTASPEQMAVSSSSRSSNESKISFKISSRRVESLNTAFEQSYRSPTKSELDKFPEQLRYMSRHHSNVDYYWLDMKNVEVVREKLFGKYTDHWRREKENALLKLTKKVCDEISGNSRMVTEQYLKELAESEFPISEEEPVPKEKVEAFVPKVLRDLLFVYGCDSSAMLVPFKWMEFNMEKLGTFGSTNEEVDNRTPKKARCLLLSLSEKTQSKNVIEDIKSIKRHVFTFCKKTISELIRSMFVLKIGVSDGAPYFFYNGTLDLPKSRSSRTTKNR